MSRYKTDIAMAAGLVAAAVLVLGRPALASTDALVAPQQSASQSINVERPEGQIVVSDLSFSPGGKLSLSITDTRADDPGWSVSVTVTADDPDTKLGWKPSVGSYTPAFADADGTVYAQQVSAGPSVSPDADGASGIDAAVLGSAPRGHGLGIAVLDAKLTGLGRTGDDLSPQTVTITVV